MFFLGALLCALGLSFFYLVVLVLCTRILKIKRWFLVMTINFVLIALVFATIAIKTSLITPLIYFASVATIDRLIFSLASLVILFLPALSFYSMIDHSIRVRALCDLVAKPQQAQALQQFVLEYDPLNSAKRRLAKIVFGQYAKLENNSYTLTAKGKKFGFFFRFLKNFFATGLGG